MIARSHRKSVCQPRPASRTECPTFPFISLTIGSPLDAPTPTRVKEAQPARRPGGWDKYLPSGR